MKKTIIKDQKTGNRMTVKYAEDYILVDTKKYMAELFGNFQDFPDFLEEIKEDLEEEIKKSIENAFFYTLEGIATEIPKFKIIYNVKSKNSLLEAIDDFGSIACKKNIDFEIQSKNKEFIAKANNCLIYYNGGGIMASEKLKRKQGFFVETELYMIHSNVTTLSEVNDVEEAFEEIQTAFGLF